tara:strand:- start:1117 stop:1278 length:162 start_codon:yes stop_codon:yes gene_type:complete
MIDVTKFFEFNEYQAFFFENMHYSMQYDLEDMVEKIETVFNPVEVAIYLEYIK